MGFKTGRHLLVVGGGGFRSINHNNVQAPQDRLVLAK